MARLSWFQCHLIVDAILLLVMLFWTGAFQPPTLPQPIPFYSLAESFLSEESTINHPSEETKALENITTAQANATQIPLDRLPMRTEYEFALVADLDLLSKKQGENSWQSFLKKGVLRRHPNRNYTISWTDTITLSSQTATNNRAMELSELIKFKGSLLAVCDYTGIVYKISPDGQVFQRHAIADGNGKQSKPFKAEWATLKDGLLHIGSIGKEWVRDGQILHFNPQWIKTIDSCGYIKNRDWGMNYNFLRNVTNTVYPGYLIHEAVEWDPDARQWLFLPRKASSTGPYSPEAEENHGTNMLIIVDEHFKQAQVKHIGPLEPKWGFTSMKLIPETNEIIALKVMEAAGQESQTMITIFDKDGNFKLEPDPWVLVSSNTKYEGLSFL